MVGKAPLKINLTGQRPRNASILGSCPPLYLHSIEICLVSPVQPGVDSRLPHSGQSGILGGKSGMRSDAIALLSQADFLL